MNWVFLNVARLDGVSVCFLINGFLFLCGFIEYVPECEVGYFECSSIRWCVCVCVFVL